MGRIHRCRDMMCGGLDCYTCHGDSAYDYVTACENCDGDNILECTCGECQCDKPEDECECDLEAEYKRYENDSY